MFGLFKSLTTEEVYKLYEETVPNLDLDGYPYHAFRSKDNFCVSPYNSCKKESCSFSMKVKNGKGLSLDYSFYYNKKDKEFFANVWFMDVSVYGHKKLQEAIIKAVPKLNFNFMQDVILVYSKRVKCTKLSQVKDCINEWVENFNESGAIDFFADFKREILKK